MTAPPTMFKAADLDVHVSAGRLGKLFGLLKKKYRDDPDPAGRAKIDIARLLASCFDDVTHHYQNSKSAAVKALIALQKEALVFYQHVLTSKDPPNVKRLHELFKDMDRQFRKLAKSATQLADDLPPLKPEVTIDPKTKITTFKFGGGVEAGGATYTRGPDVPKRGAAVLEGPHPGRKKAPLPVPEGMRKGEHIGHGVAEGGLADPRVGNVLQNLESEAARSNLSPKKKLDLFAPRLAAAFYEHRVVMSFVRHTRPGEPRPHASTYEILIDGVPVYKITIPNE